MLKEVLGDVTCLVCDYMKLREVQKLGEARSAEGEERERK